MLSFIQATAICDFSYKHLILDITKYSVLVCLWTRTVHVGTASKAPASQKQQGAMTPSTGQTRTPPSASFRTPTSSGARLADRERPCQLVPPAPGTTTGAPRPGTPSTVACPSTKSSDDSKLYPDDDVSMSQARPSLARAESPGGAKVMDTVIPETIDDLAFEEALPDEVVFETLMSAADGGPELEKIGEGDTGQEGGDGNNIAAESEMVVTESGGESAGSDHPPTPATGADSPLGKPEKAEHAGACGTRRQAFLRNANCPMPTAKSVPGATTGIAKSVAKKGAVGRGRSLLNAERTDKKDNMKPLTHFGLHEKFRPPAAVAEGSKGRGRGAKASKRKRDAH